MKPGFHYLPARGGGAPWIPLRLLCTRSTTGTIRAAPEAEPGSQRELRVVVAATCPLAEAAAAHRALATGHAHGKIVLVP